MYVGQEVTVNTTTEFRQYLREAGEPLLLPVQATEVCARAAQFIADSRGDGVDGFAAADVWIDPALGHPLPRYAVGDDGDLLPWAGIDPTLLWHPLLWLPKRVALPAKFTFDDGSVEVETLTEWSVRVMLECMQVGLWDVDQGWADVWSLAGIDSTADGFRERVLAWQAGGDDAELDAVSLESIFDDQGSSGGIYRKARNLAETVSPVATGTHARFLADAAAELDIDADDLPIAVATIAGAALVTIADEEVLEQLADVYASALEGDGGDSLVDLERLKELLTKVAAEYSATVDAAQEALAA